MKGSNKESLYQLRNLADEIKKMDCIQSEIDALKKQIEDDKQTAKTGIHQLRDAVERESGSARWDRSYKAKIILQIVFTILLVAATALSEYMLITGIMASEYAGAWIFASILHGAICVALIIVSIILLNKLDE